MADAPRTDLRAIPDELRRRPQWVTWKYLKRGGDKPTKVPFQPDGRPAKSDDPGTWASFGEVIEARNVAGPGFVFSADDPYIGIDLDNAIDDGGKLKPGFAGIVKAFATYTEVSPSGKGVKLWIKGEWPGVKTETGRRVMYRDGQVEAYWRGRYFAVTGLRYPGTPETIAEAGDTFARLYRKVLNPAPAAVDPKGDAVERCVAYLKRLPDAVSGQDGHGRTFHAACECFRFGLTDAESRQVMDWWNGNKCAPPWTAKELDHKLDGARKRVLAEGQFGDRVKSIGEPRVEVKAPPDDTTEFSAQLDRIIAGDYQTLSWPWRTLTDATKTLRPETITVISGSAGSSKSLMISEACLHWLAEGVPFVVFHLEEGRVYHQRRALAQLAGDGRLTNPEWIRENADDAREAFAMHEKTIEALGSRIYDPQGTDWTTESLLGWVRDRAHEGNRLIVVDPVTAADSGREPWRADREFVLGCKHVAESCGCSVVVVTHPRSDNPHSAAQLDNHAGGRAWNRFSQGVFNMIAAPVRSRSVRVHTIGGVTTESRDVNRVVYIAKTRDSWGTGEKIGFFFDSRTLRFTEQGVIERKRRDDDDDD